MKDSALNPYRKNSAVIRRLFSGSFTLSVSAVLGFALLLRWMYGFILNEVSALPYIELLFLIALRGIYSEAKSKRSVTTYKPQLILIKFLSITAASICALITALSALIFIFNFNSFTSTAEVAEALLPLVSLLPMMFFINLFRFARSVNKSVSSIFLYRKGALGAGIFGIISAPIIFIYMLIAPAVNRAIYGVVYYALTRGAVTGYELSLPDLNAIDIAAAVAGCLFWLTVTVFCLAYNSYIKKLTGNLYIIKPQAAAESEKSSGKDGFPPAGPQAAGSGAYEYIRKFVPQTVFKKEKK